MSVTDEREKLPAVEAAADSRECVSEEWASLRELYFAVYPQTTDQEFAAIFKPGGLNWRAMPDTNGRVRLVILIGPDECVYPLARPRECAEPETLNAFLALMPEVAAILSQRGLGYVSLVFPANVRGLGESIERAGYATGPLAELRFMHLGPAGIERAN